MDPEEEEPVEEDPVAIEVAAFGEFLDESEDDEEIPEKVLEPCSARPWPNCVLYLAGEPWVNPAAEGSGLWPSTGLSMPTNPPFFGLLGDTVYVMPDGLLELVRPWHSREYPAGAVVRVGPNKLYIRKTSGSGTNAPNPNAGNDHWDQVAGSLPIQLWLTRQVHPNLALPLPIPQAMDPQTAGLPGEWDLVLFEATLTGTFGAGTYNAVRGPVRHTWDPCADIAVASDYVSRIGLSVINSANVPSANARTVAEFPGGTNNCVGFILENRADLVFRFEPYFSVLSSLMLTESSTALGYLADNLDAHTRCFYASGTTNRTHWQPELNQSRDDVKNFPLRLGKRDGEQGTSDDLLTFAHSSKAPYARLSDSNDATAGLFALAAVRYFRYGGNDGKDWMEDNFEAVSNALLRNVVMRRRGINHSTAYGTANSIPTSGSGKQAGRIRSWNTDAPSNYALDELVWNADNPFESSAGLRTKRFRRISSAGVGPEPGVGTNWSNVWASGESGEAEPGGFLTDTFQFNDHFPFAYTLDAIEAFAGYRAVWQLWTLSPWAASTQYRACDVVSLTEQSQTKYYECKIPHESSQTYKPGQSGAAFMWNELPADHFGGTSTEAIFGSEGSAMRNHAATLASWIHPSRLLDGLRIMFKRDEADWNESGESHWFSVSYDTNKIATADELHHANQMKRWDNDFLVLPYAIIYDVFLDDSILVSEGLVAGALDLYMSKVVNHHWSRNYSMFAEAQWAAALAKKGNAEQAQQCIDYVLSHQMREGKATNRDLMWLALAEKWIGDSEYVFR